MSCPRDLLYTSDHEWARLEGNVVTIGITEHAQDALGDVVFVELPELDQELNDGDTFGVVESVKAVNDLFSPCEGEVIEVNDLLNESPELVNEDPYGKGWMVKIRIEGDDAVSHLLDPDKYDDIVDAEG